MIYIYIHVIRDQSLITVGGGLQIEGGGGGGSEVLPLPGTLDAHRCPYRREDMKSFRPLKVLPLPGTLDAHRCPY